MLKLYTTFAKTKTKNMVSHYYELLYNDKCYKVRFSDHPHNPQNGTPDISLWAKHPITGAEFDEDIDQQLDNWLYDINPNEPFTASQLFPELINKCEKVIKYNRLCKEKDEIKKQIAELQENLNSIEQEFYNL